MVSKIHLLIEDGQYEEVLNKISDDNDAESLLLKVIALNSLEKYDKAMILSNRIIKDTKCDTKHILEAKIQLINSKIGSGIIKTCLIDEIDILFTELENIGKDDRLKAYLHLLKGELNLSLGEVEEASIDLNLAETIGSEIKDKILLSNILNINARLQYTMGDNPRACEYLNKTLRVLSDTNNFDRIAKISGNLGILHHAVGNLNEAKLYYESTLATLKKSFNRSTAVLLYDNLGRYYCAIGDAMHSLEYHFKSLEIAQSLNDKIKIARIFLHIGDCYRHIGKIDVANDYYTKSLEIREYNQSVINLGDIYYSLIISYIDLNNLDKAIHYKNKIDAIHSDNKHFNLLKKISNALVLKNSGRRRNITDAEILFNEIIQDDIINFEYTVIAFHNLSDILIQEYKEMRNPKILEELMDLLLKMERLNKNNNSQSLRIELYLLKSMLHYIDGKIQLSKNLIRKARDVANTYNLVWMASKISTQEMIYGENIDLPIGIEIYLDYLKEYIVNPFKHIKNAEPQFVMILNQSGLVAFSLNFSDINEYEIELIGSFLSAINSFGKNAFSSKKSLRKINYEEYNIIIKDHSDLLFCYSYKGYDFKAENKLIEYVEYITGEIKLLQILMNNFLVMEQDPKLEKIIRRIFFA